MKSGPISFSQKEILLINQVQQMIIKQERVNLKPIKGPLAIEGEKIKAKLMSIMTKMQQRHQNTKRQQQMEKKTLEVINQIIKNFLRYSQKAARQLLDGLQGEVKNSILLLMNKYFFDCIFMQKQSKQPINKYFEIIASPTSTSQNITNIYQMLTENQKQYFFLLDKEILRLKKQQNSTNKFKNQMQYLKKTNDKIRIILEEIGDIQINRVFEATKMKIQELQEDFKLPMRKLFYAMTRKRQQNVSIQENTNSRTKKMQKLQQKSSEQCTKCQSFQLQLIRRKQAQKKYRQQLNDYDYLKKELQKCKNKIMSLNLQLQETKENASIDSKAKQDSFKKLEKEYADNIQNQKLKFKKEINQAFLKITILEKQKSILVNKQQQLSSKISEADIIKGLRINEQKLRKQNQLLKGLFQKIKEQNKSLYIQLESVKNDFQLFKNSLTEQPLTSNDLQNESLAQNLIKEAQMQQILQENKKLKKEIENNKSLLDKIKEKNLIKDKLKQQKIMQLQLKLLDLSRTLQKYSTFEQKQARINELQAKQRRLRQQINGLQIKIQSRRQQSLLDMRVE